MTNGHPAQAGASEGDPIAGLRVALRTFRPSADVELMRRAYDVAAQCHQGQTRRSGDPYITHPVKVATILAGLGADDQMLCAGILHDTLEYTPCTRAELRRDFGAGIATMVAEHTTLSQISRRQTRPVSQAMAVIRSTDARVVAMRMADRLHNMRTLQFLPQAKQLRKAREVLDLFVPAAQQFNMDTVGSELEALAFAALIRNRRASLSCRRAIVALDIECSTSRPDPVKAEFRVMLYELFDAALRSAEIYPCHRDQFMDRGDGLLALIHGADRALEALLVNQVLPVLSRFLTSYNISLPPSRSCGSAWSSTQEKSTTTSTDASARRWTWRSASSMLPASRWRSRRRRARSCSLSLAIFTVQSCGSATREPACGPSTAW